MERTSSIDDAEFSLPREFLTDDDFLVEKENKDDRFGNCLSPYDSSHGFELDSGFSSTVKPIGDEERLLTRKMAQSSLEDDLSGSHAFPAGNGTKAWGSNRCGTGGRWNQNYAGVGDELALMNRNGYNKNHNGRGILDLPIKHPLAAAKISNDGSGYYNRQSLQYQMLQAIQFQKRHRQLVQQSRGSGANSNNNKIAGSVNISPSAWSNQHVLLGDRTVKRGSTGTGVFLPRCVNHATAKVRGKPMVQPSVRSSPSLNDGSWSNDVGFSSQMKMEQPVEDPRLPLDWAY